MGKILLMDGKVIMIINEIEIMFFNVYYVDIFDLEYVK